MNIQIAEKDLMKLCYQPKNGIEFNCKLNLEDITDENYSHAQLLLADVFEKFRETCIEIY